MEKLKAYYCGHCWNYRLDENDDYCPRCGEFSDWLVEVVPGTDNYFDKNYEESVCQAEIEAMYEEYKTDYAESEIYSVDELIESATDMGGDWIAINTEAVEALYSGKEA